MLKLSISAATVALTLAGASPSEAAVQLFYDFDGSGTTAANAGAAGADGNLLLKDAAGNALDLHGADGSGLTGQPGDKALDLTQFTFGSNAGYGVTQGSGDDLGVRGNDGNDTDQLTISAWYKQTSYNLNQRLTSGMHEVRASADGGRWTYSDASSYDTGVDSGWTTENQWIFIAVTLDESTDTVTWYRGTENSAVQAEETWTDATGNLVSADSGEIFVGNRKVSSTNNRVLDGWIDNLRISNDVQTLTELEATRLSDVPEPSSMALIATGVLLALTRRRQA